MSEIEPEVKKKSLLRRHWTTLIKRKLPTQYKVVPVNSSPVTPRMEKNPAFASLNGGKWSRKYKKSINCKHPHGFSQKQYCKYGRKTQKQWKK